MTEREKWARGFRSRIRKNSDRVIIRIKNLRTISACEQKSDDFCYSLKTMMPVDSEIETKVAMTAFCWKEYADYGSERKAIRALCRRKGMESLTPETAQASLMKAVEIFERTRELRLKTTEDCGRSSFYYLTKEEFDTGRTAMRKTLNREFPEHEVTINYMMGMLWELAYQR